jgi:hypothetical protein
VRRFLLIFLMYVLALADGLCCAWFVYPILVLVQVSGDRDLLYQLGPVEYVPNENGAESSLRNALF